MTLDTTTLRAYWEAIRKQQGPEAFAIVAHVGDGIALLDALDEERERVRVLTEALERQDRSLVYITDDLRAVEEAAQKCATYGGKRQVLHSTCADMRIVAQQSRLLAEKMCKVGETALATAGGEGATT